MPARPSLVAALIATALVTSPLAGAAPAAGQEPSELVFEEAIDVNLVQVEVVVTGKGEERVSGLAREDFRLLVDGEPVEIEFFEAIDAAGPAAREGRPDGAAAEPTGRSILVFVDDVFTQRGLRRRLLDALAGSLDALGPSDRMAVVRYAGNGLEVLTGWTGDREALRRTLTGLRDMEAGDLLRGARNQIRNFDQQFRGVAREMHNVTRSAALAMRSFADASGRRLLVPVTGGWYYDLGRQRPFGGGPRTLSQEASTFRFKNHAVEGADYVQNMAKIAAAADLTGEKLLRPITDTANRLGYTVYPMHLGGQSANLPPGYPTPVKDYIDETRWGSVLFLAKETGGRIATEGAASPRPLDPVVEDTGSYYLLGFTRETVDPGKRLDITVELPGRKKLDLRHRRNVFELTAEQRAEMDAEQALVGAPTTSRPEPETAEPETAEVEPPKAADPEAPLEVTLGEVTAGREPVEVPLSIDVPVDGIAAQPVGGGFYAVKLTLRVAAVDAAGERSEILASPVELTGKKPEPGTHITLDLAVEVPPTARQLAVTIEDKVGGGFLDRSLPVGSAQ